MSGDMFIISVNTNKEWQQKNARKFLNQQHFCFINFFITSGDETCTSFLGTPQEVRTKCVQKYSDILLLVADKDGKPVWDLFWFPSACGCAYERIINFNRF